MNIIDDFINEYLQISKITETNEQSSILNKLSAFLEYTRIKDRKKALEFKTNIEKMINANLRICIKGQKLSGKSSLINAFLESNIIPKNKSLNFIIKYSHIPYLRIHKDNIITTHSLEMLEIIKECDFAEIFLDNEILKKVTLIESNNDFYSMEKCDFCISVNNHLDESKNCNFVVLNKIDLLTEGELQEINKIIKEKYLLLDSSNSIDSAIKQNITPIVATSIINNEDSKNLLKIFKEQILPQAKILKDKKIKNSIINLMESTIKSYNELIQSYENLSLIIKKQNFIEYAQDLHLRIQNNLDSILKTFSEDFKDIGDVFWENMQGEKIDFINKTNILKVKKINKKMLYSLDIDSIKEILFNDNSIYARKYRANIYNLSKLRDSAIEEITSRREYFISDVKIWQAKVQNQDNTITFITEIHNDNLLYFALKIYDNIINIFILLTSQIIMDLYAQISKIEFLIKNEKALLIEFIVLKVNQQLAMMSDKPNKDNLQNIVNKIIDDYLFKDINTFNASILDNTAQEIESTKSLKCEQINKIIDDIKNLKIDINHLFNNIKDEKL
ncbi:hypothetical protein CCY99_05605 [Helicobacter sp. 16-1353]|uniref:hypothetical protein n=1 Tax=Helicobacter sp. 16-1353 TaxID=2004996 RepID=UPI000DCECF0F|nr:hypothetical protein [Helicobacter sp. 16-1353]RAX53857.1 hypothetical protein CCY99_05605 [Helicobacter sp. 16-1353]